MLGIDRKLTERGQKGLESEVEALRDETKPLDQLIGQEIRGITEVLLQLAEKREKSKAEDERDQRNDQEEEEDEGEIEIEDEDFLPLEASVHFEGIDFATENLSRSPLSPSSSEPDDRFQSPSMPLTRRSRLLFDPYPPPPRPEPVTKAGRNENDHPDLSGEMERGERERDGQSRSPQRFRFRFHLRRPQ